MQSQLSSKPHSLETANGTITDTKVRLGTLESEIESTDIPEKLLMKDLDSARTLSKDAEDKLANQVKQRDLWIKSMVGIAECLTAQISKQDMKSWAFSVSMHEVPSVTLTLFFEGLIEGLKTYEEDRATCFVNEAQKLARDALFMVLSNLAFRHPDLNIADGFKRLPLGADTSAASEKAAPLLTRFSLSQEFP